MNQAMNLIRDYKISFKFNEKLHNTIIKMHQRFVSRIGKGIARNFGAQPTFTYFKNPTENLTRRATLVPGIFIGPELTESVLECLEACHTPLKFDCIANFSFENEDCKEKLLKNPYLLVGNLGTPGSKYIENMKCYKHLDLSIHSNLTPKLSGPPRNIPKHQNETQKRGHDSDKRKPGRRVFRNRTRGIPRSFREPQNRH